MEQFSLETEMETEESISTADISHPTKQRKTADVYMKESVCWADLPAEILEQIANRLPLVELLCFRSVCKDWRSSSSLASAECENEIDKDPWFLLYRNDDNSHCRLYPPSSEKVYSIDIPELKGTTCIASKGGWLLLVREGSVFFLCPFSRARIDLPVMLPHPERTDHVATITAPPTAADCVVGIINRLDGRMVEVNTLKRGANEWDTCTTQYILKTITGATFCKDTFYFLDNQELLMRLKIGSKELDPRRIVGKSSDKTLPTLPFFPIRMALDKFEMKQKLGLEEGYSLNTCGTYVPGSDIDVCIHNENIKAEDEQGSQSSCVNYRGVWIHPRFFQIPQNQNW